MLVYAVLSETLVLKGGVGSMIWNVRPETGRLSSVGQHNDVEPLRRFHILDV
jgi:hypothetical protein